jgi:hypothetical protein|tara:strand:- start:358 stop:573 length:216 start_codon:yes stop_codon:yes gene_type:complete
MIEIVVALCMFIDGELKEHRIQPAMSDCLKGKRQAERQYQEGIQYKCDSVSAELESNVDGSKSIKKILNDK